MSTIYSVFIVILSYIGIKPVDTMSRLNATKTFSLDCVSTGLGSRDVFRALSII